MKKMILMIFQFLVFVGILNVYGQNRKTLFQTYLIAEYFAGL